MPSSSSDVLNTLGVDSSAHKVKDTYRVVIMGSAKVGKTAIVHQFLYDLFPVDHKPTVEELHFGEYDVGGVSLTLDLLDTSGSYEFPAMRRLAISSGDVFILVYSIDNLESFEEVRRLRDQIIEARPKGAPIVVVGNKCDLVHKRLIKKELAETIISIDWENGFAETSAKDNTNIISIFRELLHQAKINYAASPSIKRRRTSLPSYPTSPKIKSSVTPKRNSCAVS